MERQNPRLMKEFRMLQSELPPGIVCTPQHESLTRYEAQINGPPDTPYTNGRFLLDIVLPPRYPLEPPSIKFRTRVYHPNIDDFGNICLEVLKTGKKGCWSPQWTVGKVLVALSVLLESPNPSDPLMPEIADQITNDYKAFVETAREWTKVHAMAYGDDPEEYVRASQLEASPGGEAACESSEAGGHKVGSARAASPSPGVSLKQPSQSPDLSSKPLSSKISSQSPDRSTKLLPPVHDKLPAAKGMRRLGLSRSRTAPSKKKKLQLSSTGTTRFALKPLVMSRSHTSSGSSPAESVELTSDDTPGEDPCVLTNQDSVRVVKKKRGKVSQLHSPPKRVKKGGAVRRKDESVGSEPAVGEESVDSEPVMREESVDSEPRGAGSSGLDFGANDSEDYECLLSPGESAGEHSSVAADAKWPILSVDSCDAETDDGHSKVAEEPKTSEQTYETIGEPLAPLQEASSGRVSVEPLINVRADRRKGKGVDLSHVQDGEHILEASHFGPLDLGLPPVRVSAQRRLMRRRARDPTH
ncbi:hypothetical protein GGH12_000690 [Coemansia sp. RSA 1822]|nr:hypothetical protein LPJ76_002825 [Coemansia sp. RSA 638]KAJ2566732.1 hypothetical protein GGH12_000690 [Coemansia sp. RSA 1822]